MKKIGSVTAALISLILVFSLICANGTYSRRKMNQTTIVFEQTELEFGDLKQGEPQQGTFRLTNTGDAPFVLTNVTSSCGCTTPDWPRGPVKPGKTGEIKVTYDAQHTGRFIKTIRVEGNVAGGFITLSLKGQVQSNEFEQSDQEP
jgi:hypothetical protein